MNTPTLLALALAAPVVLQSVAGWARKNGQGARSDTAVLGRNRAAIGRPESLGRADQGCEFQVLGRRSAKALLLADGTKLTIQADADEDHSETAIAHGNPVDDFVAPSAPKITESSGQAGSPGQTDGIRKHKRFDKA